MKLEPIVMIHGGLISDTTSMSMSQACSTAPPIVPPSQKTTQRTTMSATCRASFIAGPKGVPISGLKGKKPRLKAGLGYDDDGAGIPCKPHLFAFAGQHVRIGAAAV